MSLYNTNHNNNFPGIKLSSFRRRLASPVNVTYPIMYCIEDKDSYGQVNLFMNCGYGENTVLRIILQSTFCIADKIEKYCKTEKYRKIERYGLW